MLFSYRNTIARIYGFLSYAFPVRRIAAPVFSVSHRLLSYQELQKSDSQLSGRIISKGNPVKAELLTSLFRGYGFNDIQISRVVKHCLKLSIENNLSPKLDFLSTIFGASSSTKLPIIIAKAPRILATSLEDNIIPCYNYLKTLPFRDGEMIRVLKSRPLVICINVDRILAPNMMLLRDMGVPESSIMTLISNYTLTLARDHGIFKTFVHQAITMGLDPRRTTFIQAIHVLMALKKGTWDRKLKLYESFGLSTDEIMSAFRRYPLCMALSEKRTASAMDFFVNKLNLAPATVIKFPSVLLYSLEQRVIPRSLVIEELKSSGLLKKISLGRILFPCEEAFLNMFVYRHMDDLPHLINLYRESKSLKGKV